MKKRVVVTGLGIVSPLGLGKFTNWEKYLMGMTGIRDFDLDGNGFVTCAGKIEDNTLEHYIPEVTSVKIDRFSRFAMIAAKMALDDANIDMSFDREKVGIFIGSAYSGLHVIEEEIETLYTKGAQRVHPLLMQKNITNAPSGEIAIKFGLRGPNIGFSCGTCSSDYAIVQALNILKQRDIDAMVVGGTEAPLLPRVFEELRDKGLFNTNKGGGDKASCPFDYAREGFVLSEGAGILVLETLKSAEKRGADIYGELVGYGTSYEWNGDANQRRSGFDSKISCVEKALESSSVYPWEVDYVNASGISGIREDRDESQVMRTVFGRDAKKIPTSSIKGSLGYSQGASGAIDALFSLLSLEKQLLPQTNRLENVDHECNALFHLKEPEAKTIRTVLSNNLGLDGNNVSLVFRRL